jgi:alkanesulfonate monooxygenase SsuD/methylene tetrahydromethanopterin reductase-like flavin-dependent oxidoreductase (luciferase family)
MQEMTGSGKPDQGSVRGARAGVVLRDPIPWAEAVQIAQAAEEMGYRALFVPEITGREAFATLTGFAGATTTLWLGTGLVTMRARNPVTTAMAAATVQDISEGRLILGVGSGTSRSQGGGSVGTLDRLRAYVRVLREALSGQPVGPDHVFDAGGFVLELEAPPPPIWLGALGDRMVSLAGEVADGILLNWCTPERVSSARAVLERAASEAGRDPGEITVAVYVRACLGVEAAVAKEALRAATGMYAALPTYLRQMRAMGLGAEAEIAAKAAGAGRPEDVPDSLVGALTVSGGRSDAMTRFQAYAEAGADLVLWYPVPVLDPVSSILGTVMAAAPSPAVER